MFCNNCGSEINNNGKFCGKCGSPMIITALAEKAKKPKRDKLSWIALFLSILLVVNFFIPSFTATDEWKDDIEEDIEFYKEMSKENDDDYYEERLEYYEDYNYNPAIFSLLIEVVEDTIEYFKEVDDAEFKDFFEEDELYLNGFVIILIPLILVFSIVTMILCIIRKNFTTIILSSITLFFSSGLYFLLVGTYYISPFMFNVSIGAFLYIAILVALIIISVLEIKKQNQADKTFD